MEIDTLIRFEVREMRNTHKGGVQEYKWSYLKLTQTYSYIRQRDRKIGTGQRVPGLNFYVQMT